jgi:hypothetical protein
MDDDLKSCPVGTMYEQVNLQNHLYAIDLAEYGPADPRQPNTEFWQNKMKIWDVNEGTAIMRVCTSCFYANKSPEMQDCIIEGPGGEFKESDLPNNPVWSEIDGLPTYYCTRWNMTVNPLRTCNGWVAEDWDEYEEEEKEHWKSYSEKALTYKPTTGMASAARRALKWKDEGRRGGTRVGLARANQLVRRENLSESTVLRMHSFFSRHAVDKQATGFNSGEEGFPSPGRVAWDLWGGDAGETWSKTKRDQIMRRREQQ